MKKSAIFILAVVFVLGCALPGFAQSTPEITIEVAHMFPEGDPSFIAVNEGNGYFDDGIYILGFEKAKLSC